MGPAVQSDPHVSVYRGFPGVGNPLSPHIRRDWGRLPAQIGRPRAQFTPRIAVAFRPHPRVSYRPVKLSGGNHVAHYPGGNRRRTGHWRLVCLGKLLAGDPSHHGWEVPIRADRAAHGVGQRAQRRRGRPAAGGPPPPGDPHGDVRSRRPGRQPPGKSQGLREPGADPFAVRRCGLAAHPFRQPRAC